MIRIIGPVTIKSTAIPNNFSPFETVVVYGLNILSRRLSTAHRYDTGSIIVVTTIKHTVNIIAFGI